MRLSEADILIAPGLGNSGPEHWQRRWGQRMGTAHFIEQANWDTPDPAAWRSTLERAIMMATRPVVLIAHSLAVIMVVQTAHRLVDTKVRGAFLVSVPDLELNPDIPEAARAFQPIPREPLPFPSLLVASSTDPLCSIERAAEFGLCWGSDFHSAGDAGHINTASGHGPWPEGLLMFTRLMQRLKA